MKNLVFITSILFALTANCFPQENDLSGIAGVYYSHDVLTKTNGAGIEAGLIGEKSGVGLQVEYYFPTDSITENYVSARALLFIPTGDKFLLKLAAGIQSTDIEGRYTENFLTLGFAPTIFLGETVYIGVQANLKVNDEGVLPSSAILILGLKF
jgi:hypothetical protein